MLKTIFANTFAWMVEAVEGLTNMLYPWVDQIIQSSPWIGLSVAALGLLAALAPCQVATNLAVLGFMTQQSKKPWQLLEKGMLLWLGKSLIYTSVFFIVVFFMLQARDLLPWIQGWRKAMGPLMLAAGLYMLFQPKLLQIYWGVENFGNLSSGNSNRWSSLMMGIGVGWAFCPTVFWIYFGVAMPLFSQTRFSFAMPALFAFGTLIPAFLTVVLTMIGISRVALAYSQRNSWQHSLQKLSGISFVLGGSFDIFYYWSN